MLARLAHTFGLRDGPPARVAEAPPRLVCSLAFVAMSSATP
jgi:hypothetical protein